MNTKFKRHQKVKLLIDPDPEYIEYKPGKEGTPIKKGMYALINLLLPDGQYHVEILDEKNEVIAFAPMSEDFLELVE